MILLRVSCAAALATLAFGQAHAALTITNRPTVNVNCESGVCTATAPHANLNAADLEGVLQSWDTSVVPGVMAKDIEVNAAVAWVGSHQLKLDAYRGITIAQTVAVMGTGGLKLNTDHGGSHGALVFSQSGHVTFADTSSNLVIDGITYVLAADFATLSADIAANPGGTFAWARDYDAKADGVYTHPPVTASSGGWIEGLGNTIKNLTLRSSDRSGVHLGLFDSVSSVSDLHLVNWTIRGATNAMVGGIAGVCNLDIFNVEFSGKITVEGDSFAGGICGSGGFVFNARSSGRIEGLDKGRPGGNIFGGITGEAFRGSVVYSSYSTMDITCGKTGVLGGLVGSNQGAISDSYAMGRVIGGDHTKAGGLIGIADGPVSQSYATGAVAAGSSSSVGGLVGEDLVQELFDTYWDIDTSGQSHGVGNNNADTGVTGLTTAQFLAGLPDGFDPAIWAQSPEINGGYPYLIAMPPR
jgi:hypothetical protein